jgi:hypothetical protein
LHDITTDDLDKLLKLQERQMLEKRMKNAMKIEKPKREAGAASNMSMQTS